MYKSKFATFILIILCSIICFSVYAYAENFETGTYIYLGKYNDEPILWRTVIPENDENGILMVSDKILCYKIFDPAGCDGLKGDFLPSGTNLWSDSAIRIWLNATEAAGSVKWINNHIPTSERVFKRPYFKAGDYPYAEEAGFLSDENFTANERSVMKSASHWQALSEKTVHLSENGLNKPFYPEIVTAKNTSSERIVYRYSFDNMDKAYYGAMYRLNDTIFLLDEKQLYYVLQQLGTTEAKNTKQVFSSYMTLNEVYWLRTPVYVNCISTVAPNNSYGYENVNLSELGVRPAFYLNEANVIIKSGTGTEEDPYIIDGINESNTMVFCNGGQVQFDQQPVNENDRLLVPVRAIAETLGAEVNYNSDAQIITAVKDDRTVVMQIDNTEMGNGVETFTLDVAPRIIGDRTMVPLRAISEAFDCKVEYLDNLNRVVIDTPQPEHKDEDYWQSDWDIIVNGKGKK